MKRTMSRPDDYQLRPLEASDLERVLAWRNSDRIRANMYTDHLISTTEHKTWYQNLLKKKTAQSMIFEYREQSLGVINISRIDPQNRACYWGFYLGEINTVKKCSMVLGYLGLNYIFEILRMRKVYGEVFSFNSASIQFHKKIGFTEGKNTENPVLKNGKYEEIISMVLPYEGWMKRKNELKEVCFHDCDQQ